MVTLQATLPFYIYWIIHELNYHQRRAFQQFVTGAPRLPPAGLSTLNPKLTIVRKVRREKICERMKFLQALVLGCDKVIEKATMLDEIINYVQSLQSQVEGLNSVALKCSPDTTKPTTQTPPYAPATTTAYECPLVGAPVLFPQQVQRGANPQCVEGWHVININTTSVGKAQWNVLRLQAGLHRP